VTEVQKLREVARVIRSKNAGPFELTLDVIFGSPEDFHRVRQAGVLHAARIAELYGVTPDSVLSVHWFEPALAFKATLVRARPSGSAGDSDVFGAQQHAPLLDIEVPPHQSGRSPTSAG